MLCEAHTIDVKRIPALRATGNMAYDILREHLTKVARE
jgi:hypothetical protein